MEILSDFRTRVLALSRVPYNGSQQQNISTAQLDQAINDALRQYSETLPVESLVQLTTNTTGIYTLTDTVAAWDERHELKNVYLRYKGELVPLDSNHWQIYSLAGVYTLKILPQAYGWPDYDDGWAESNSTTHLYYTSPHSIDVSVAGDTTIRVRDIDAVASLAASITCEMMAAEAADQKAGTMTASPVNYGEIASRWREQADRLMKKWSDHLARFEDVPDAWGEWDFKTAMGRPLFHGQRWH